MYRKKLRERLPAHLQAFREFDLITGAEQTETDQTWGSIETVRKDQFVVDATESGAQRYEKIFAIVPKGTDTLEERKFRILAKMNKQLPYTFKMLEHQLLSLCGEDGYELYMSEDYILVVKVGLVAKANFDTVKELLESIVPQNLVIDVSLKYNTHAVVGAFTHGQLTKFTHNHIRNEVI